MMDFPCILVSLMSAISLQFLKLCLSVGMEKLSCKLFFHLLKCFSCKEEGISLHVVVSWMSVKGWLSSANHKEEEGEGRSGGKDSRSRLVLPKLIGRKENPRPTKKMTNRPMKTN